MVAIFCALSKSSEPITILSGLKKSSIADPSLRNSGLKTILSDLMSELSRKEFTAVGWIVDLIHTIVLFFKCKFNSENTFVINEVSREPSVVEGV